MSYTQDPYGMLLRYLARDHRLRQRQARIPDIMCRALRRSLVRRGRLQQLPTKLEVTVRFSLNECPTIPYGEFIISLWRPDLMVALPTVDTGRFIRPAEDRGVMQEVLMLAHRIEGRGLRYGLRVSLMALREQPLVTLRALLKDARSLKLP